MNFKHYLLRRLVLAVVVMFGLSIVIFAISRIVGWGAHRIEEIANNGKIIRPGYTSVAPHTEYVRLKDR